MSNTHPESFIHTLNPAKGVENNGRSEKDAKSVSRTARHDSAIRVFHWYDWLTLRGGNKSSVGRRIKWQQIPICFLNTKLFKYLTRAHCFANLILIQ